MYFLTPTTSNTNIHIIISKIIMISTLLLSTLLLSTLLWYQHCYDINIIKINQKKKNVSREVWFSTMRPSSHIPPSLLSRIMAQFFASKETFKSVFWSVFATPDSAQRQIKHFAHTSRFWVLLDFILNHFYESSSSRSF